MTSTTQQSGDQPKNLYLDGSLWMLFAKTALPIILIMAANGLFTLVDAYYLGEYVGVDALTAVTLVFPLYMLLVALSTLVSSGYSSVLSRLLGADKKLESSHALLSGISLSVIVCLILIVLFALIGHAVTHWVANGNTSLASLGHSYMSILVYCSPLVFILGIGTDTFRCEGKLQAMTAVTVFSTLLNFFFNYLFIVQLHGGVAGSAYGTVAAQGCALLLIIYLRKKNPSQIETQPLSISTLTPYWGQFLALGAPMSLGYLGISLASSATLFNLQLWSDDSYSITAGAYGIITRLITFIFLPLLGLSMAFQTIAGNNHGAKAYKRSTSSLKMALCMAFTYCLLIQLFFFYFRDSIGYIFVDNKTVVSEISRILPISTLTLFIFGPIMMLSAYFQAIGDATRSAILSIPRTYLFSIPLMFILPYSLNEWGIWLAGPTAELLMLLLTTGVLWMRAKQNRLRFGLYGTSYLAD